MSVNELNNECTRLFFEMCDQPIGSKKYLDARVIWLAKEEELAVAVRMLPFIERERYELIEAAA